MIRINSLNLYYLNFPLKNNIITSFGVMKSRPSLILELKDNFNNSGYGEVWCNFPSDAANYRFNIFKNIFVNKLKDLEIDDPLKTISIFDKIKIVFIQSGDLGTYNNIVAAIDCAIWDLFSKNKKLPLYKFINNNSKNNIQSYASGINPEEALKKIEEARSVGIDSFKVKIGFNNNLDINLLNLLKENIKKNENLMFDVNQGWNLHNVKKYLLILQKYKTFWIEEPISASSTNEDYNSLSNLNNINIALGENINNINDFDYYFSNNKFNYIQPDITKFGGISLIFNLSKKYNPKKIWLHFLGSGVGLLTSAHVMAAINPEGKLETDINENLLRTKIFDTELKVIEGKFNLNNNFGIGMKLNKEIIKKYLINSFTN